MSKKSVIALLAVVALVSPACEDNPNDPEDDEMTFTAQLSPANEVPAVIGPEASGSGTVTVLLEVNRDSSGTITSGTADFTVNFTGFPAGTPITMAHIHTGIAGAIGTVVVDTGVTAGQVILTNGSGSFTRQGIPVTGDIARQLATSPSAFYFNAHSVLNPGGVARGQLSLQ